MRIKITLITGLVLVMIAIALTLSGSPVVVARTNGMPADYLIAEARGNAEACQVGEVLPANISAIRVTLESIVGPRVSVAVRSNGRILTSGAAESGWTGEAVTVPIRKVLRPVPHVQVCFKLGQSAENVVIGGLKTGPAVSARGGEGSVLRGRFTVEYLRAGRGSWWSLIRPIARHIGLGRAPSGAWIVLLLVVLMGAVTTATSWLILEEMR